MPQSITLELLRKRAEHNEGEISTLEEVTLHQQSIERIELLDRCCPRLKILYLQANEIEKIENVRRLKSLQYLNLALNKIEKVENLEGCESLEKLDLTLNCIRKLSSLSSLTGNYALRELFLVGNPCASLKHYRSYVIGLLPQLESLDGVEILYTERLAARQDFPRIQPQIEEEELNLDETNAPWVVERAPEIRRQLRGGKESALSVDDEVKPSHTSADDPPLTSTNGRILNSNQADVRFDLREDQDAITLTIKLSKLIDTSLVEVDVQPTYVRVVIKGKLLQLVLPSAVAVDRSTAKRSIASGNLVITMPMVQPIITPIRKSFDDDIPPPLEVL